MRYRAGKMDLRARSPLAPKKTSESECVLGDAPGMRILSGKARFHSPPYGPQGMSAPRSHVDGGGPLPLNTQAQGAIHDLDQAQSCTRRIVRGGGVDLA